MRSETLTRRRSLRLLCVGLAFAGVSSLGLGGCGGGCNGEQGPAVAEPVTVYVVRHAEKEVAAEGPDAVAAKDPALSREGQVRALGLAEAVPVRDIKAIYVTKTKRSEDTAAAVAAVSGVEPTHYPPTNYAAIVERLRRDPGSSVLLVGHSNTIPPLLEALGVKEKVTLSESQYGDLWVVVANSDGTAIMEHRRFGDDVEKPGQ